MSDRRILVTSALPYANGPIHIGHLVEYIQTDVWVRFQKLRGNRCAFLCADDTHGTAVMMSAKKAGVTEEEFIARVNEEHRRDFAGFGIEFDHYGSTHSAANRKLCDEIWGKLRQADLITERDVTQLYDPVAKTFLADRFVKGTCPVCGLTNQYGDNCDNGHTYSPAELIDPVSTLSGATPEVRSASHLFVRIEELHSFLDAWTQGGHLQTEVANYLKGQFLGEPLRDWDVSRPAPYFGFEIPDAPGHYWYVWFDAPIGYMASTAEWCERTGENFDDWWRHPATEVHHFIGRDITYFHCLFWPAMLKAAGFNLPTRVHIHGFLTVDGEKMSKSKGTFIRASKYLEHLDPSYLRYYFASKLGPKWDDLDLNLEDFENKVNADLVGKVVNLASRTAKFVSGKSLSDSYPDDGGLFAQIAGKSEVIAEAYERGDFMTATREIVQCADEANRYVEQTTPWSLKKDPGQAERLRDVCTVSLNLFRQLTIYLTPILPRLAEQSSELLNSPIASWEDVKTPLLGTPVNYFKHMLQRVDPAKVQAMVDESKPEVPASDAAKPVGSVYLEKEPLAAECTIEDFAKVDLRVAEVLEAEHVEGADKLLKLKLSLGGDNVRQVFAGIKSAYQPEDLKGRLVICVANLAPRKMRFGMSEGMVCAAGAGGTEIHVLSADSGAKPGMRVH
ncbi:MAG: methionine--tRNA ligase [Planctomycetota bacterium]|nr:methionine--tRNA ligase [Planctomycetaceae bacterium]MDQ3330876.1 methionine--tRNA ligase [Planctomycetota bacterium]